MQPIKGFLCVVLAAGLCGCSVLNHMDQLMIMGDYARDKNVQNKVVDNIKVNYDALVTAIHSGKIKNYPDQTSILTNFGEPIEKRVINVQGQDQDRWLYREAIPQKAKDKVYLYFDRQGKLITYSQEKIQWF